MKFDNNTAFCKPCLAVMADAVAASDARRVRVAAGDLRLMPTASEAEREEILEVRRRGNFGGITL